MNLYRDQGVVLRTYKLGEADRIVVLLTQGEGKVRAVAKGVRKTKSRFGGRLEPFSHVDLSLYRGRGDLDQVAQEREASLRLYLLLLRALRALDSGPRDPSVVLDAFLLKLMALEGYRPSVQECAVCRGAGPYLRFSAARGGAVCERCRTGEESVLDSGTVALLADLLGGDLDRAARAKPPAVPRREAGTLVKSYIEYHLDRRLRSYPLVAR